MASMARMHHSLVNVLFEQMCLELTDAFHGSSMMHPLQHFQQHGPMNGVSSTNSIQTPFNPFEFLLQERGNAQDPGQTHLHCGLCLHVRDLPFLPLRAAQCMGRSMRPDYSLESLLSTHSHGTIQTCPPLLNVMIKRTGSRISPHTNVGNDIKVVRQPSRETEENHIKCQLRHLASCL
jgi:hypothetical protein